MSTEKMLEKILSKIESMDSKIKSMNSKIESMDSKIKSMDSKIESMDSQLRENTQILKALEHNSQVHKAELDKLNIQVAEIKGELTSFKKETTEKFDEVNNNIKEIQSDVSLANVTASKNRIDIEMIKNVINK